VAVQATRELARTNMTYDRVEDWVSPFYGLIDQATKVWRIVTQGNDSRTVAEKFNEKVISEKELRNFFGDISRRNQEVLDGTLAGFRINCETPEMKKTGFPPVDVIGTGPNPPPIHVGTLTAMDVADLLDISAGGLTVWLWGTAATDPTMTLAIVAAVVQGIISSVQYIKEDELIRGVRDELLKFPWNALYGGSERRSIFDAVDKRIDDVFNKQKAQIRSVQK